MGIEQLTHKSSSKCYSNRNHRQHTLLRINRRCRHHKDKHRRSSYLDGTKRDDRVELATRPRLVRSYLARQR